MAAIAQQPRSGDPSLPRSYPNGVIIRNITGTPGDCEFAGKAMVQGFESKFLHAVGRNNMERVARAVSVQHSRCVNMYHRIFIAEVDRRPAGLLELKFHGDRNDEGDDAYSENLGCRPLCGLSFMDCVISSNSTVPTGTCYVDHIVVAEGFRGKGIGKALLDFADEEAVKQNCKTIFLWVADDNRARHLYERQGYSYVDDAGGCLVKCATGISKFHKMEKRLS